MGVAIKEDGETVGFFSPKKVVMTRFMNDLIELRNLRSINRLRIWWI